MEGHDDDSDRTPSNGIRIGTIEAVTVANLALALQSVATHCLDAARAIDTIEAADRGIFLSRLAHKLRESGDLGHDAARIIEEMINQRSTK